MMPTNTKPMMVLPALVILDRDGVINYDCANYIKSPDEWIPIPGSLEAIAQLTKQGISVAIASNQRGITLGLLSEKNFQAIHNKMNLELNRLGGKIDQLEYCTADNDDHPDRKPNPGMLKRIIKTANLSSPQKPIYFIGDKISDIQAAQQANCIPILVKTGHGTLSAKAIQKNPQLADTLIFESLAEFVYHLFTTNKGIV